MLLRIAAIVVIEVHMGPRALGIGQWGSSPICEQHLNAPTGLTTTSQL